MAYYLRHISYGMHTQFTDAVIKKLSDKREKVRWRWEHFSRYEHFSRRPIATYIVMAYVVMAREG